MRDNNQDLTLARNYIQKYQFLISEYELVKKKAHPKYNIKPLSPFAGFLSINRSKTYKTVALDIFPYKRKTSFVSSIRI